jgi:RNA polymerase sigma-70 factor (ECF subfamily)
VTISNSEFNKNLKSKSILSGELASKITQGDKNARNEFVQINYQWLLFIVRRKFAQSNNHEDIVQDSFMLVLSKLQKGKINQPHTILAYLRTTAINIGFEYLRKDKKFTSAIDQDFLEVIEDAKEDILSTIIWNDKIKYVKQVMTELKVQRDKDILIKFYFEDQDKPTICQILNLSTEHFDRVLYRAKERLKQIIAHHGDNNPSSRNSPIESSTKKSSSDTMKSISLMIGNKLAMITFSLLTFLKKGVKG